MQCSPWGVPDSFGQGCLLVTKMCFVLIIDNLPDRDSFTDSLFKSRLYEVKPLNFSSVRMMCVMTNINCVLLLGFPFSPAAFLVYEVTYLL